MKITKTAFGMLAVAALAFAAGRSDLFSGSTAAIAQDEMGQEAGQEMEMTPEQQKKMEAWMKAGTPGEHHKHLQPLIGEWDGEFTMWMEPDAEPMKSVGTVSRKWVLDGRYIQETVEAETEMGSFEGIGFMAYDNIKGEYHFIWMDSMSTGIYSETGQYDAEKGVMTTKGTHIDPMTDKPIESSGWLNMSASDRHMYVGYMTGPDGKKFKSFEGVTVRRK